MSDELMQIYFECSDAIDEGLQSIDDCILQYPQYEAELRELLTITESLGSRTPAAATSDFRQTARQRLLAKLPENIAANHAPQLEEGSVGWWSTFWNRLQNPERVPERLLAAGSMVIAVLAILCFSSLWLGRSFSNTAPHLAGFSRSNQDVEEPSLDEGPELNSTAVAVAESSTAEDTKYAYTAYIPTFAFPLKIDATTAKLEVTHGIVEMLNENGQWQAVSHMAAVKANSRIRTRAISGATLLFFDGSQLTLEANSELSLDTVDANLPENGFRTIVMTQWTGRSEHEVDFRGDNGSRYEVLTPAGSGRARGTTFSVTVLEDGATHFQVDEGRVQVTNANITRSVTDGQLSIVNPAEPPSEPYFVIFGQGEVTAVGDSWVIGGQTFNTNAATITIGNPQVGDIVSVVGYLLPDGSLIATHIVLLHNTTTNQFSLTGVVESISTSSWMIAGQQIDVDSQTSIAVGIEVGDRVRVRGIIQSDGTLLATEIMLVDDDHFFEFVGIVEQIDAAMWTISGLQVTVNEATSLYEGAEVGDVVRVLGFISDEGIWLATEIILVDDGETAFEIRGTVDNLEPWIISGQELAVDEFTLIDEGIVTGDDVVATGRILNDGTWLASEIRLLESANHTFSFVGIVETIDPWMIGGIPIVVDDATQIAANVDIGTIVRVQGVILDDGSLLATEISPVDAGQGSGCFTLTTTVISFNGDQITVAGLPPLTMGNGSLPANLTSNSLITITICIDGDGQITIITIIIIILPPPPSSGGEPPSGNNGGQKVTICHKDKNTLSVSENAVSAHLGHGDYLGACSDND